MTSGSATTLLGAIYPDELVWSFLGRVRARYRCFDMKGLLGAEPSYRKAFPTRLAPLAAAIAYTGAPDATALIEGHTFFKFAFPEISPPEAEQLAQSMVERTFPSFAPQHLIHNTSFQLRLCPHCLKDDEATFGTAYWHLLHQVPTVWRCHVHHAPLHATEVTAGQRQFVPVAVAAAQTRELGGENLAAQKVVLHAYKILAGRPPVACRGQVAAALKSLLLESGYFMRNRIRPSLVEEITAAFGEGVVSEFNLADEPSRLLSWVQVPKLALACAAMALPFEELLARAAGVESAKPRNATTPRELALVAEVRRLAPSVAARLKQQTGRRVSPWALANALADTLGLGFATNYSWKPAIRSVLRAHTESRGQFRARMAQAA